MKILVACEYSGRVREAFRKLGHDAWSCDLLESDIPSEYHILGDVRYCLDEGWDLMIAHPPCTHLAASGARWFPAKRADGSQEAALDFVRQLMDAPIDRIALENPVGIISSSVRKPDQIIQPWMFGHDESKATCLWLKGLPQLVPTKIVSPVWHKNPDGSDYKDKKGKRYSPTHFNPAKARYGNQTASGQNKLGPSPDRWKIRSMTYQGIADAMAAQWGMV